MITETQRTEPIRGANARRTRCSAHRLVTVLTEYFAAGDTEGATDEMLTAGRARLEHPDDTLRQLADRLGWSRDSYAGRLRRLERLARHTHARLVDTRG